MMLFKEDMDAWVVDMLYDMHRSHTPRNVEVCTDALYELYKMGYLDATKEIKESLKSPF